MNTIKQITFKVFAVLLLVPILSCTQENVEGSQETQTEIVQVPQKQTHQYGHDWPRFLGPDGNGTSRETGILTEWSPEGPPVIWSRPIGESYGAPVVSRGRLLIFHRIGNEEVIESMDALTGSDTHWKFGYPTAYVDRYGYNGGPRSSPTIDGDRVYTYGAEGVLTCLDFETGALVWQRQVNDFYEVPQGFFGVGVTPVIEEDMILINVGGPNGAGIVAFNKHSGETVWTASNDTASYSTPIVATLHGERLAIFHTGDGLLIVEAKTGKIRHQYPFRSRVRESAIAATPLLIDDTVFLSATYKIGAVALKITPDSLVEVWKNVDSMQNHWAMSTYKDGYLYGMDGRHESGANFRCVDFETGEVIWSQRAKVGRASFIVADGQLIALGERGHLLLIRITPDGYQEVARARVLNYPSWTPPILAQGYLYVRNENTLLCLDLRR